MIGELVQNHGVRTLTAVFKRENQRSRRLLERLGFAPASAQRCLELAIEPDENLMQREMR